MHDPIQSRETVPLKVRTYEKETYSVESRWCILFLHYVLTCISNIYLSIAATGAGGFYSERKKG
jgi:hypothetical protein